MALKEYYEKIGELPTPKKEFREKVAESCGVTEMTVFRWISGKIIPEKLTREKLSEITGLSVEELFPNIQQ
jgi:transcriptional regulator with XRE-family HTH domain